MKHGEMPRRSPSPREGRSRGDTRDPEVTAPPQRFSASLARLLQAPLSPAGSSRQSQGTVPGTRVRRAGPGQRQPRLWAAALWKTVYFIFMCQDLYKKGIVQL